MRRFFILLLFLCIGVYVHLEFTVPTQTHRHIDTQKLRHTDMATDI